MFPTIQSKTGRRSWQVPCNGFCNCYSRQVWTRPQSTLTRSLMKGEVLSQKGVKFCLIFILKLFSFPGKLQQELTASYLEQCFICQKHSAVMWIKDSILAEHNSIVQMWVNNEITRLTEACCLHWRATHSPVTLPSLLQLSFLLMSGVLWKASSGLRPV